jgi:site-specific DNA-methyltransferase (adenine-specific)
MTLPSWQIHKCDCRYGMTAHLNPESVALFCTSPPYAQGKEYEQGLDWCGLHDLMAGVAEAALPVCKPGGFFFVNFGETTAYPHTMAELYNEVFRDAGWLMHSRRIWHKEFAKCALSGALTHSTIPAAEWECLWTFRKPPNDKEVIRDRKLSLRGVWKLGSANNLVSRDQHPAAYPVELPERAIRLWTDPGDLVCDPFTGCGTTGVACLQLGRRFVGFEQREDYAALARQTIGQGQPALLTEVPA